ncbi:MAG: hypothetical protein DRI93_00990 [Aquificota bacterium]|nr:MAG: hypothetical protein DRI93_00990 [Aquificota bacterium]
MTTQGDREEGFGFREAFLLGLGLLATFEEETRKRVDQLVKKGAEKEEEGKSYLRDLKDREGVKSFEARLEKNLKRLAELAGLATKEDIRRLERRLADISAKLEEKGGS